MNIIKRMWYNITDKYKIDWNKYFEMSMCEKYYNIRLFR
jgi:hypothetical protein